MDKINREKDLNQEAVSNTQYNRSSKSLLRKSLARLKDLGKYIGIITGVLSALAVGVGIIGNVWFYLLSQYNARELAAKQDLSTYTTYGELLDEYRNNIEPATGRFLSSRQFLLSEKKNPLHMKPDGSYNEEFDKEFKKECKNLLKQKTKTGSGLELFYLPDYNDYRKIHNFYETLGFSLKKKAIHFDTVFDMVVYPAGWKDENKWASFDPFYNLELCVRDNWFGENHSLPDFSDNFLQLGYNYQYRRLKCDAPKRKDPTACKEFTDRGIEEKRPPWAKLF
jgi:hypothetical protein